MDDYFAGSLPRSPGPVGAPPAVPPTASTGNAWGAPPAGLPPYAGVPQQWAPYAPPQAAGRGTRVLIGVAVAFGLVVVLGIAAAVAIPAFLDHRSRAVARATTVTPVDEVLGMPRLDDALSAKAESMLSSVALPGTVVTGVYGAGGTRLVLLVGKHRMRVQEERDFMTGADRGLAGSLQVSLRRVSAGRLGGTMRCGTGHAAVPVAACVFTDPGAYGVVVVTGSTTDVAVTARAAREAVEHRA